MNILRKIILQDRMKIAIIDMGTNTFHLLLAEVENGEYSIANKFRQVVKIGEHWLKDGWITVAAQKRTLNTLVSFKQHITEYGADRIFAMTTSAMRNAENGLELVRMIKETTDIDVRIISGQEEATLIFGGVRRAVDLSGGSYLIMDIGGGSIEFIIAKKDQAMWMESFEIGGQRLIDNFHESDPITFDAIENLENYFEKSLKNLHEACDIFKPTSLIGVSGTFDTLSEIYCIETGREIDHDVASLPLSMGHYHELHSRLITYDRNQRLAILGMIEMRVDMIVVASVLISYVLRKYDLTSLGGSSFALKEGVLFDILDGLGDNSKVKN